LEEEIERVRTCYYNSERYHEYQSGGWALWQTLGDHLKAGAAQAEQPENEEALESGTIRCASRLLQNWESVRLSLKATKLILAIAPLNMLCQCLLVAPLRGMHKSKKNLHD